MPRLTSRLAAIGIVAALCLGTWSDPASAQRAKQATPRAYDGNWSVLIVTESGECDRAYRYGISIRNGGVYYDGGAVILSGQVAPNGTVNVTVRASNSGATGSGKLNRNAGQGRWSGHSGPSRCSGYWTAERRG